MMMRTLEAPARREHRATGRGQRIRPLRFSLLALLLLAPLWTARSAFPSPAVLATARSAADDLTGLDLEDLMEIEIVSGASRYDQKLTEAPSAVTIITAEEIRAHGYGSLAEILEQVRGFYITYDRNYSYIGVRGFGPAGDYNTRVLVLLDGHRLNENIYGSAIIDGTFIPDVDLIDRIEVIRGPSSSIYGAHAFFGVINVITRADRPTEGASAYAALGSHETVEGGFAFGKRWASGETLLLAADGYDSQGASLYFPGLDDPATNDGISRDCDDERYYNAFGAFTRAGLDLRGGLVWREKGIPTSAYGAVFNDPRTRSLDIQGFLDLRVAHRLGPHADAVAALGFDHYVYEGDYLFDESDAEGLPAGLALAAPRARIRFPAAGRSSVVGLAQGESEFVLNEDYTRGDWITAEYTATWQPHARHKLIAGLQHVNNLHQEQRNYDYREVYFDAVHDSRSWGVYLQDESVLLPRLVLNGGIRYDHYSLWGGVTRPRVALIFSPLAATTLKLIYGEAFRPPNEYELYYTDSTTQAPALDLDPETIQTLEAVLEQYFGRHLRASFSAFAYDIDRLITFLTDPEQDLLIFANAGTIRASGAEAEVEVRLAQGWHGRASYAYCDTEDRTTKERLLNSPRNLLKIGLSAPLLRERLTLGLNAQYVSERRTKSGAMAEAFWLGNATLTADLWRNGSIALSVHNLLDADRDHVASEEQPLDVIPQDGRTMRLKITQKL